METMEKAPIQGFSLLRACGMVFCVRLVLFVISVSSGWIFPMHVSDADYQFNEERQQDFTFAQYDECNGNNNVTCNTSNVSIYRGILDTSMLQSVQNASCTLNGYASYTMVSSNNSKRYHYHITASHFLRGQTHWDVLQYAQIALSGYTDTKQVAFYPLFPKMLQYASSFVPSSIYVAESNGQEYFMLTRCPRDQLAIASLVQTIVLTLLTVACLHTVCMHQLPHLTESVFTIYALSPANVFFLVGYSEQQFSLLFLQTAMTFHLFRTTQSRAYLLLHMLCLAVGTSTRPNGITFLAPCLYYFVLDCIKACSHLNTSIPYTSTLLFVLTVFICHTGYTLYIAQIVCKHELLDACRNLSELVIETTNQPYLLNFRIQDITMYMPSVVYTNIMTVTIPLPNFAVYPTVQKMYWNVGFLQYWTINQVPNFILALPVFVSVSYLSQNAFSDFLDILRTNTFSNTLRMLTTPEHAITQYLVSDMVPWVVHAFVSALICLLYMNVQVATRFLLTNPVFYLLFGYFHHKVVVVRGEPLLHSPVLLWGLVYNFVGILMFSTGLPWT